MAAIDNTMISNILNATTPTGAAGIPGTYTALNAAAMKVRLNSTASTASAAGTELTGTGYTAGGTAITNASAASSAGSAVTLPATAALSWVNGSGGAWSIVSMDLTSGAGVRAWFGNFTGQPISVANGNTFQIAVAGVSISLT
jgi:hypothetical protein